MAKIIMFGDDKCVVVEAKNIGFVKAMLDIVSDELGGMERLAEEAIKAAAESLPEGFDIQSVDTQIFPNGKDLLVKIFAVKKS